MAIYLCYASERAASADAIAVSLRHRGYQVFLGRDDLPAGLGPGERIGQAVSEADLFIFLISPESVTPGRATLAALELARRKWRRPGRHVLPVMIAETDPGAIPPYLGKAKIFRPAGDVGDDVGALVWTMAGRPDKSWVIPVALATGVLTGLMTIFVPISLETTPHDPRAAGYIIHAPGLAPLGAPFYFGVGLALLLNAIDKLSIPRALPILAGALVGWLLAINLYLYLADLGPHSIAAEGGLRLAALLMVGALCGAVGALFTWLGAAFAVRRLMRRDACLLVTATGLVFGGLIVFLGPPDTSWKLFCPWQAAVAGMVVRARLRQPA